VSISTVIPGPSNDVLRRRRLSIAKIAVSCSLLLLVVYIGQRGRQYANLQIRLEEIGVLCGKLQQRLDDEQTPTKQLFSRVKEPTLSGSGLPPLNPQIMGLKDTLQILLDQFDSDYAPGRLSETESLDRLLAGATLANAGQRFDDALAMITEKDEKVRIASTEAGIDRHVRVLQIRGDSFYGLCKWPDALDCYRQILILQPNRIAAIARVATCYYALGRLNEALATCGELALVHRDQGSALLAQEKLDPAIVHYRQAVEIQALLVEQEGRGELAAGLALSQDDLGNALLVQENWDAAIANYQKAIEIQTRLIEQDGRPGLGRELAMSYNDLGNALFVQWKLAAAVEHYEKAIEIRTRLMDQDVRSDLAGDLAVSHKNQGNALLAQGENDAALGHYEKTIKILTPLVARERQSELSCELAMTYNNRGVVHRAQGKLDAAIADFEIAIKTLGMPAGQQDRSELAISNRNRGVVQRDRVKLDVAVGYSEKSIEMLTQTEVVEQGGGNERAVALATALKNRGYAHLVQGKPVAAIADFKDATDIYATLVEQQGQRNLARQFAKTLSPIAWIYATNPDSSLRNGSKAKEYALKACELSDWSLIVPIETLAAACAEAGSFADAVKWQEKAMELAPGEQKAELRPRLELYKSGNPYRAAPPKPE
jgi:tetratricopeptide (TPR) repeat protein